MNEDLYIDTLYLLSKIFEKFKDKNLKLARIITSEDDLFDGFSYKVIYLLIEEGKLNKISISPYSKEKGIITFNLLEYSNVLKGSTTENVLYMPSERTQALEEEIKSFSLIEFTSILKTPKANYKSYKEIPFLKEIFIPKKYKIYESDKTIKIFSQEKDVMKDLLELLENIVLEKQRKVGEIKQRLEIIKRKVIGSNILGEEEFEILKFVEEILNKNLKDESITLLNFSRIMRKNKEQNLE